MSDTKREARPAYVPPTVNAMDEEEMLKSFQLTSAMSNWWVPGCSINCSAV